MLFFDGSKRKRNNHLLSINLWRENDDGTFHHGLKKTFFDKGQNDKTSKDYFQLSDTDIENFGTGKKKKKKKLKMIPKIIHNVGPADRSKYNGVACLFSISEKTLQRF